jgi:heavy-metal-associated domain-containing protein
LARARAETVYLEHSVPGRARLRVPKPRSAQQVRQIAGRVERAEHVHGVEANPTTGSLLVRFSADDPLDLIIDELALLGFDIASAFERKPANVHTQTRTAAVIENVMSRANSQLHLMTRGHIDIRLAVPAIYMLLGVRNLMRQRGRLRDATWYQLMYWAFDSFFKLHEEQTVKGATPGRGTVVD